MLIIHAVLTAVDVLFLAGVLIYFLNRIAGQLKRIGANLTEVAAGVRTLESRCSVIGPAAGKVNRSLVQAEQGLRVGINVLEPIVGGPE